MGLTGRRQPASGAAGLCRRRLWRTLGREYDWHSAALPATVTLSAWCPS